MEIANFFWHGKPLSIYEWCCISSFVNHGFKSKLWTFEKFHVPKGVEIHDTTRFYSKDHIQTFTQAGVKGSLASFASAFRLDLLKEEEGWWFDTDCFCLKDQEAFSKISTNKRLVAGWEDEKHVNNGVLKFNDKEIAAKAIYLRDQILEYRQRNLDWGDIGPRLMTELVRANELEKEILPPNVFYPEHYSRALNALDPSKTDEILEKSKNSLLYHCWNEIFSRNAVSKSAMPPKGSFLNLKFTSIKIEI